MLKFGLMLLFVTLTGTIASSLLGGFDPETFFIGYLIGVLTLALGQFLDYMENTNV